MDYGFKGRKHMKITLTLFLVISVLFLSGCQAQNQKEKATIPKTAEKTLQFPAAESIDSEVYRNIRQTCGKYWQLQDMHLDTFKIVRDKDEYVVHCDGFVEGELYHCVIRVDANGRWINDGRSKKNPALIEAELQQKYIEANRLFAKQKGPHIAKIYEQIIDSYVLNSRPFDQRLLSSLDHMMGACFGLDKYHEDLKQYAKKVIEIVEPLTKKGEVEQRFQALWLKGNTYYYLGSDGNRESTQEGQKLIRQAISTWEKAARVCPAGAGGIRADAIYQAYVEMGDYDSAITTLETARKDVSQTDYAETMLPEIEFEIARCHAWAGRIQKAHQVYQKVIDSYPHSPQAKRAAKELERIDR